MEYAVLTFVALFPATFYMFYINAFDFQKPEPPKVLLISAILGGIAALPVILLVTSHQFEAIQIENAHSIKESLEISFLKLAIPAEIAKWLFLCVFLSFNRFFDEYIDGMVYSVCLSMGFAGVTGAWGLSHYLGNDFSTFIEISALTALVLIPIHFISGSLMGYFFALPRKKAKPLCYGLSLLSSIVAGGLLCSIVLMIGRHWEYYFFIGIVFAILAAIIYTQIFKLLEMDGIKFDNH